ncbi:glutamate receptor 1-like [Macrobrachium rosenbergii]|uniref:glutamate receptor 1-like n=1 Tax=Macrobrachium rosenbergii TaxID=79674 RepID=UPI0034D44F15
MALVAEQGIPKEGCIPVAVGFWSPFVEGTFPNYTGPVFELFKVIQQKLGFCYELKMNVYWGIELPNGTWTGMMGMLQRKEAEVAIGPIGVTYDRYNAAEFSSPIFMTDQTILYLRPRLEPDLMGFVKPFTLLVWLGVLASTILVTIMALVVVKTTPDRLSKRFHNTITNFAQPAYEVTTPSPTIHALEDASQESSRTSARVATPPHEKNNSSSLFLWSFMILVGQGLVIKLNRSETLRTIVALWFMTTFILGSVYKGNLKAMLIAPKVKIPFDSLEELVAQHDTKWSFPKNSIIHSFLEASYNEDPTSARGKAWQYKSHIMSHPNELDENLRKGIAGLFARTSSLNYIARTFSMTGSCGYSVARKGFMTVIYSMGFTKGSPLLPKFNRLITSMTELGVMEKILSPMYINVSHCLQPQDTELSMTLRPLAIGDFLGIFSLFGIGAATSVVFFILEIIVNFRFPK